jgi:hypothetical protein
MKTWTFVEPGAGCEFLEVGPLMRSVVESGLVRPRSQPFVEQKPPVVVGATQITSCPYPGISTAIAIRALPDSTGAVPGGAMLSLLK